MTDETNRQATASSAVRRSSRTARGVDWLIRHHAGVLLGSLLVTIAAMFPAWQLRFDQSIESLFAHTNPRLIDYLESKSLFGGDEFVIVAYREPNLLNAD